MKPFLPSVLPCPHIDWGELVPLMGKANRALARYDGLLQNLVNPDVLLSPLRTQEAVLSSKIEGTQANLQEVLEFEAEPSEEITRKNTDILEILNYRRAMQRAIEVPDARRLTLNLIREIHAILLDSVRGADKGRGDFRRTQVYIAPDGQPIEKASYIPPDPLELPQLLDNFEKYVHGDEQDIMVQLAMVHAQFELIHPFLDGNGRVGRILIPLFLYEKEVISSPVFFMSAYLESHRDEYYSRLQAISANGDFQGWIHFFLRGMVSQAEEDTGKVKEITALYENMKHVVTDVARSQNAIRALDAIFATPVFSSVQFANAIQTSRTTSFRILNALADAGVIHLVRSGSGQRPAVYVFMDLLNIVSA